MAPLPLPTPLKFTNHPSLSPFQTPLTTWLDTYHATNPAVHLHGVCTGVIIFDDSDRVLLVQRAATDSMPNRWEIPGGAVDREDGSILEGAVREVWEEAGLLTTHLKRFIPEGKTDERNVVGYVFANRTGQKFYCRFAFEAEVEPGEVRLDPDEHQDYVWATEEEACTGKVGDRRIVFTTEATRALVLKAFRTRGSQGSKEP